MNAKMRRLQKREIVVVTLCVAFLISTLGAVGQSGRQRAKEVVCQANLHQWGGVFLDYIGPNNGKFLSGCNANGYWWPMQLTFEQQDRKSNRTWFCPTATTPIQDEHGVTSAPLTTHDAWGIFYGPGLMTYQGKTYSMNPNGIAGSFGLNGYTLDTPETGIYAASRWGDLLNVPHANSVPMFIDALRFDLWPLHTDSPASTGTMAR